MPSSSTGETPTSATPKATSGRSRGHRLTTQWWWQLGERLALPSHAGQHQRDAPTADLARDLVREESTKGLGPGGPWCFSYVTTAYEVMRAA